MTPQDIQRFWFKEHGPDDWFKKDEAFDSLIRERFLDTYYAVASGATASWRVTPEGRLAEILVLDQFARNMFRGAALAFTEDGRALRLAQEAVAAGDDQRVPALERQFFYMPYMHSEHMAVHEEALPLFQALGNESLLGYEYRHREIIARFNRYPHRNEALGRSSTPEEEDFIRTHKGF